MLIIYISAVKGYELDTVLGAAPPVEKLLAFLERLELSKGFQEASVRLKKQSLQPRSNIVHQVLYPGLDNIDEFSQATEGMNEFKSEIGLTLDINTITMLEKYLEKLENIFQSYCSYGESKITRTKLRKMMKDCGIVQYIRNDSIISLNTSTEGILTKENIDIIFITVTDKKINNGKMDFKHFIQALGQISQRVFSEQSLDESLIRVIKEYILRLGKNLNNEHEISSNNIKDQMESLNTPSVIEILSLVHRSIIFYYRAYSNQSGLMDFNSYLRFCKDFSVFPDLIAKSKLQTLFSILASIHLQTEQPEISLSQSAIYEKNDDCHRQDVIDEHLFVEGLALIAEEISYKEPIPNTIEKICLLMERMSQSNGSSIALKKMSHNRNSTLESKDMLTHLKNRYPELFESASTNQNVRFNDLFEEL